MMKIAVTGSSGFVGKNLIAHLERIEGIEVFRIERGISKNILENYLATCDLVYHLAGVNRPKDPSEFYTGNTDFTTTVVSLLSQRPKPVPLVMTSSTQAEKENDYGLSKRKAEEVVEVAANSGRIHAVIYRLPGVFGKWCRPNYNSVVATFCFNVANGNPIEVRDPLHNFPLVYIDDVVAQLLDHIFFPPKGMTRPSLRTQFIISLGELSNIIQSFPNLRKNLRAPEVSDTLTKYLYSTYLSYLPVDSFSYPMKLMADARGDLFEWIKADQFGQIFVSTTKPGITRGNHYHHTKTEKFLVIRGEAIIRFRQIHNTEIIEYRVTGEEPTVVDIPTGYTHNITNTGDSELITLFWANEIFDVSRPDTYFLEV